MPRRQRKKAVPVGKQPAPTAELRHALMRCSKAERVDVLLELAQADRAVLRQLTARFEVAAIFLPTGNITPHTPRRCAAFLHLAPL
jgi:hypothetical protein